MRTCIAALAACTAATAYYATAVLDLFPLVEYRQWVSEGDGWAPLADALWHALARDELFSRHVSIALARGTGSVCGGDIRCLNAVPIGLVIVSGALLFLLCTQLRPRHPLVAGVTTGLWFFTVPMLDAMVWQATIHDRLAALLVLLGLNVGIRLARVSEPTTRDLVLGNLSTLAVVVLAFSAKEAAWPLLPSLVLAVLLVDGDGSRRQARPWPGLKWLVAPTAWATYYAIRYYAFYRSDDVWQSHSGGGNVPANVKRFAGLLANHEGGGPRVTLVHGSILIGVAAILLLRRYRRDSITPGSTRLLVWALGSLLLALAVPLTTKYASGYYLLVPSIFFYVVVYLVATSAAKRTVAFGSLAWLVACALMLGAGFRDSAPLYERRIRVSRDFHRSVAAIRALVPATSAERIYLVVAQNHYDAYMWFGPVGGARDLDRFIFGGEASPAGDRRWRDMTTEQFQALQHRHASSWYLLFDFSLTLAAAFHGEEQVFPVGAAAGRGTADRFLSQAQPPRQIGREHARGVEAGAHLAPLVEARVHRRQ